MVERRLASLARPPAMYGYEDQSRYGDDTYNARHSSDSSLYTSGPYGSLTENHHTDEQSDVDVSAQAAASGASRALPTTPHPKFPQQQQQSQYIPQQHYLSPGPAILPSPSSAVYADLPNSFGPNPAAVSAAVEAPARTPDETPVPPPRTLPPTQPHHLSYLSRRPTQVGGVPPAYEPKYADAQRNVNLAPPSASNASASGSSGYADDRPTSNAIYYAADAYGGINI